jgi:hypothetical protein
MNCQTSAVASFLVLVSAFTVDAEDAVVTVSPDHMQGWCIVANKRANGELVNRGPALFERKEPFLADDGRDLGKGAYYASIALENENTPPTVWLGLDTFHGRPLSGIALKRITRMDYYAYNAHIPVATGNPKHWTSWKLWWTYPKQTIQLQLTAESPDGKQRKQFWFMPWQKFKIRGENSGRHCKKWLHYDPIHFDAPGPVMCARWFTPGPPPEEFASWAELTRVHGDWTLVPTSKKDFVEGGWKSAGWDDETEPAGAPACTATGMCLNFVAGARKEFAAVYDADVIRWANDYRGFEGYIDWFTLGVDHENITYNFEPAADATAPKVTAITAKTAASLQSGDHDLVKLTGVIVERTNAMFALDDGSGTIIRGFLYRDVQTPENPAGIDEHWSVWGRLQRVPFQPDDAPPLLWTCPANMSRVKP